MNRISEILLIATLALLPAAAPAAGRSGDGPERRPLLFTDGRQTFDEMKARLAACDSADALFLLDKACMCLAQTKGLESQDIIYNLDASGRRLLPVSRNTMSRILSAAYAYRMTADRRYLQHARRDILTVCAFKDWHPAHYLDCAEMALAVSIAYDWLYDDISPSTRKKILDALEKHFFATCVNPEYNAWRTNTGNWNQVCNAAVVCACLATGLHGELISGAVESNRRAVESIYTPEGIYPEGPVYWCYGNMFQCVMMAALEKVTGSDCALSADGGLKNTAAFVTMMTGSTGQFFNYGDNRSARIPLLPLWYFAGKYSDPSLLVGELAFLRSDASYLHLETERLLPVFTILASKLDFSSCPPAATASLDFCGGGKLPLAVKRTGWNINDLYLAAKGGKAADSHSHQDAGSFVFDGWGVRWACDPDRQDYQEIEPLCAAMNGNLWDYSQTSARWKMARFNCRAHNVLIVNDKDIDVNAFVEMTDPFTFNLTPLYDGAVKYASRHLDIKDAVMLEVVDSIAAPSDRSACVRFNLVTPAGVTVSRDGIVLHSGGCKSLLSATGVDVEYMEFPSEGLEESVCGFTFRLEPGRSAVVRTVLRRL